MHSKIIRLLLTFVTAVTLASILIFCILLFMPSNLTHSYAFGACMCGSTVATLSNGNILYESSPHSDNFSGNVLGHYRRVDDKFHIYYAGNLQSPIAITELNHFGFYSSQDKQYILQRNDRLKYISLILYSRFFNKNYFGENE
jgi:hypothetical protein